MHAPFAEPTVAWQGPDDPNRPLVVLLHGRGSDESGIIGLANHLPAGFSYAAVRAPIPAGGGFAWFANRGTGRPVAESLAQTRDWFRTWLDPIAPEGRPVILVGFSGGAAFAGGLMLADPQRFAGTAVLYGTLPFEAGVPTSPDRLSGAPVFLAHGKPTPSSRLTCWAAPGTTSWGPPGRIPTPARTRVGTPSPRKPPPNLVRGSRDRPRSLCPGQPSSQSRCYQLSASTSRACSRFGSILRRVLPFTMG
jgi:predicted esterase